MPMPSPIAQPRLILRRQPSVEDLLRAMVEASIQLHSLDFKTSVQDAIRKIAEVAGIDRVFVIRFNHQQDAGYFMAEACAPGVKSASELLGHGPFFYDDYKEVFQPLMAKQTYSATSAQRHGANAELNRTLNTKSDLMIPIFVKGLFWGMVGFDDCQSERAFSEVETTVLRGMASSIAAAAERDLANEARIDTFVKTNNALRAATASLVAERDLDRFFSDLLAGATALSGAKSAGVFAYQSVDQTLQMRCFMSEGCFVDISQEPDMEIWRKPVPREIVQPWVSQLMEKDFAWFDNGTPLPDHPWPISLEWHRRRGHRFVVTLPLFAGNDLIGTFGQCFIDDSWREKFDYEQARVLANHAALALQLDRLSSATLDAAMRGAVLAERNRLARDIHDTLAQGFVGIIMQIEAAEEAQSQGAVDSAQHHLKLAQTLARQSLTEARRSVHALRPEVLDSDELPSALRKFLDEQFANQKEMVHFLCVGNCRTLNPIAEENLLRLAQEAIQNAKNHSGASEINVELEFELGGLHLVIRDNGCGFKVSKTRAGCYGLETMRERAEIVGGSLDITSSLGKGTEISVAVPAGAVYAK